MHQTAQRTRSPASLASFCRAARGSACRLLARALGDSALSAFMLQRGSDVTLCNACKTTCYSQVPKAARTLTTNTEPVVMPRCALCRYDPLASVSKGTQILHCWHSLNSASSLGHPQGSCPEVARIKCEIRKKRLTGARRLVHVRYETCAELQRVSGQFWCSVIAR